MPFVSRNENGKVNGVFTVEQPDMPREWLEQSDSEVVKFWGEIDGPKPQPIDDAEGE